MVVCRFSDRVRGPLRMKSPIYKRQPKASRLKTVDATPGSTRTRDRSAKQQALIVAALKLFAEKGYEVTTTREIAACAGCAEGLIHRYFGGKAGLLTAL